MKYMTKEWYETMQKTSFHLLLKVSKKAEIFSEEYFKKLYKSEEKAWLRLQESVSKIGFEDVFHNEFHFERVDGKPLEPSESEEVKKMYLKIQEEARSSFANRPAFEPEKEKKNFKQALRYNVKHLKRSLPDAILQKVADIRVLALNRASADVKKEIAAYCKANEKAVESATNAYWKGYKKRFKNDKPKFAEKFNFHDCIVSSCRKRGNDIFITFDNSGGFTDVRQIILKNCSVLKQDAPLHGAWWLYDEIYRSKNGYEIHVLLQKKDLIYFIVTVTDIEYK